MNMRILVALVMLTGFFAGFSTYLLQLEITHYQVVRPQLFHQAMSQQDRLLTQPVHTPLIQPKVTAQDTFQREDQPLWGTASDAQQWEGDANQSAAFSISGGTGQIGGGPGPFNALLGPTLTNADVTMTVSVNDFAANVNVGLVLRWRDSTHWYKALIDGNTLTLLKCENGNTTQLGMNIPFTAQANTVYLLRFRALGTTLSAKVWASTDHEPANWMLSATDSEYLSGRGGIRVILADNTEVTLTSFLETEMSTTI